MRKLLLKKNTRVTRVAKKGLKQVAEANAMHFYIPTSLWCATQQQSGSPYSKSNQYCHVIADFEAVVILYVLLDVGMKCYTWFMAQRVWSSCQYSTRWSQVLYWQKDHNPECHKLCTALCAKIKWFNVFFLGAVCCLVLYCSIWP